MNEECIKAREILKNAPIREAVKLLEEIALEDSKNASILVSSIVMINSILLSKKEEEIKELSLGLIDLMHFTECPKKTADIRVSLCARTIKHCFGENLQYLHNASAYGKRFFSKFKDALIKSGDSFNDMIWASRMGYDKVFKSTMEYGE